MSEVCHEPFWVSTFDVETSLDYQVDCLCINYLQNYNYSWNSPHPELSNCFEQVILIGVPSAILWLMIPLQLYSLPRSGARTGRWTKLTIAKMVNFYNSFHSFEISPEGKILFKFDFGNSYLLILATFYSAMTCVIIADIDSLLDCGGAAGHDLFGTAVGSFRRRHFNHHYHRTSGPDRYFCKHFQVLMFRNQNSFPGLFPPYEVSICY